MGFLAVPSKTAVTHGAHAASAVAGFVRATLDTTVELHRPFAGIRERSLTVPVRSMKRGVFHLCHHLQVFGSIVLLVAVDVVDDLTRLKVSPQDTLHDNAMLKHASIHREGVVRCVDKDVPTLQRTTTAPIRMVLASCVHSLTQLIAERFAESLVLIWSAVNRLAAVVANACNLGTLCGHWKLLTSGAMPRDVSASPRFPHASNRHPQANSTTFCDIYVISLRDMIDAKTVNRIRIGARERRR